MELAVLRRGFHYAQDGRGNRLVIHLQGCNLRCPWCSNPEGIALRGTLMETDALLPSHICPFGGIVDGRLNRSQCDACAQRPCLSHPDRTALHLSCAFTATEALLAECERARPLFFDGGGVTLSGGEPTLQFEAIAELLAALQTRGIHTAIETNGSHPTLSRLFPLTDQLIMDLKHPDDARHTAVTGGSNRQTLRNLTLAFAQHSDLLVRTPLVHGFNDGEDALAGFLDFYGQCETRRARFELLTYHEYGAPKWRQSGMPYEMQAAQVPAGTRERFEAAYRAHGLTVVRT